MPYTYPMHLWQIRQAHRKLDVHFLHGTAVLIGTMVGVGIFGIPFVFAKAGFGVGLLFLILIAGLTLAFNLMFSEIILRTKARHQIVGYAAVYLGPWGRRIILCANVLGIYGALLAYIIIAGEFSHNIFSNIFFLHPPQYSAIFLAVVAALVFWGIRAVRWVEFAMTAAFIGIMLAVFFIGAPHISFDNLTTFTPEFWFLPYGVLLFAFAGLTSIPIQREIMRGREHLLSKSIMTAVGIVAVLYLLFAITVVGVSGDVTTPDAISGLFEFLGPRIVFLGSLFGLLSITTSFLLLGTALLEIFRLDYRISRLWSWLLAIVPPAALFMSGLRTFIDVIGLVGSVAIGLESALFVFIYMRAMRRGDRTPEYRLHAPSWALYAMALLFLAGVIYELVLA